MLPSAPARIGTKIVLLALSVCMAAESHAIEMFTFFGDGSRVGLPSLEVPIEAYPGIPLRRDRLRGRRRSMRVPPASATPSRAITVRTMPPPIMPDPPTIDSPLTKPTSGSPYGKTPRIPDALNELPMPPEPVAMPTPPSS